MTQAQIDWASQHDWFVRAFDVDLSKREYGCECREVISYNDGTVTDEPIIFSDFKQLKEWAGY
jgi:hypothetical protein